MIGHFSRRRAQIQARYAQLIREFRRAHGRDPAAAVCHQLARQANLATRQGKKPPRSLDDKRAAWREELTAAFGPGAVARLMAAVPDRGREPAAPQQPAAPDPAALAERAVAAVSARRSTWTVWNLRAETERLIRTAHPALPPAAHRELAEQVTALAVSPACSISVEAPALLDEPPGLRRADGEPVFDEHAAARYTSQAVLDAEQRLLDAARTPTVAALSGLTVVAAIGGFEALTGTRLDAGQRHLVAAFASDDRLLLAGIGPAGAGKTTAMRAYAHVLRRAGHRLVPLATSAASADVLGRELSLPAENLHKFLHEWDRGPFAAKLHAGASVPARARLFALHPGDVVLVDEAGMAGTFLLDHWKADMLAGKLTLMAAGDGTDVTELSAQARAARVAAGQVESDGVVLRDGNLAGAGDWIVTRLNDRRLAVHGGRD